MRQIISELLLRDEYNDDDMNTWQSRDVYYCIFCGVCSEVAAPLVS